MSLSILLVHGFAQNRYAWHVSRRSLANALAEAGYDVFNLDLRGVGRSRERGAPDPRGFADHVEGDLPRALDAVRRASGEDRVFLVGHSLGGAIACACAGIAPAEVRGVVAIAGLYTLGRGNRFVRLLGHLAGALEGTGLARALLPASLPTDVIGKALRLGAAAFDDPAAGLAPLQAWAPGSFEPDVLREAILRSFEPAALGITLGLGRMARGGGFADASGRCYLKAFEERREVPFLALAGDADTLVPPADSITAVERSRARDKTWRRRDASDGGGGWGHMDLLLGRRAPVHVWPAITRWLGAR